MLESLLERFLNRLFGHYLHIDRTQASVGLRSGDMKLRNVAMKSTLTELFAFPARLLSGKIGSLRVAFEWRRLGSTPLVLEIEGVDAVLEDIPESAWKESGIFSKIASTRKQIVEAVDLQCEFALSPEAKGSGVLGFLGGRMLRMVEVRVKNVHVKVIRDAEFCVGATLSSLTVTNAASSSSGGVVGTAGSLDKKILLSDLAVYLNPDLSKPEPLLFILEPVSGELELKSCAIPSGRSYAATGLVRDVSVALCKAQYTQLTSLVNFIHTYNLYTLNFKTKLRLYDVWKPLQRPNATNPGSCRAWWRWAGYCVKENLRRARSSEEDQPRKLVFLSFADLVSEPTLRRLQVCAEYQKICRDGLKNAEASSKNNAERRRFLEACLDLDDLVRWRSEVVLEHLLQEAKDHANKPPTGWSAWIWGAPAPRPGQATPAQLVVDPNSIDLPKRNSLVTVDLKLIKASTKLTHGRPAATEDAHNVETPLHVVEGALDQVNVSVLYDGSDPLALPEIKASFVLQDAKLTSTKFEKTLEIVKRVAETSPGKAPGSAAPLARIEVLSGENNAIEVQTEKMMCFYDQHLVDDLVDFFQTSSGAGTAMLLPDLSAAKQNLQQFYLSDKRPQFRMNFRAKVPVVLLPLRPRSTRNAVVLNLGALAIDSVDQADPDFAEYSVALTGAALQCGNEQMLRPVDVNMTATLRKSSNQVKLFGRFLGPIELALSPSSYNGIIRAMRQLNKPAVKTVVDEAAQTLDLTASFEAEGLRCRVECFDATLPGLPDYAVELQLAELKTEAVVNSKTGVKVEVSPEKFSYGRVGDAALLESVTPPKILVTLKPFVELHFKLDELKWRFQPESIKYLLGFLKNNLPEAPADVRPARLLSNPEADQVTWTLRFTWSSVQLVWLKEAQTPHGSPAAVLGESQVGRSECVLNFYDTETYRITAQLASTTLTTPHREVVSIDSPLELKVFNVTLADHELTSVSVAVRSSRVTVVRADLERFAHYLLGSFLPAVSGDVPFAVSAHLRAEAEDAEASGFVSAGESDEEAKEIGEAVEVVRRKLQRLKFEQELVKKFNISVCLHEAAIRIPCARDLSTCDVTLLLKHLQVSQQGDSFAVQLHFGDLQVARSAISNSDLILQVSVHRESLGSTLAIELANKTALHLSLTQDQYYCINQVLAQLAVGEPGDPATGSEASGDRKLRVSGSLTDLKLELVSCAAKFLLPSVALQFTKEVNSDSFLNCRLEGMQWLGEDETLPVLLDLSSSPLEVALEVRGDGGSSDRSLTVTHSGLRCALVLAELVVLTSFFAIPSYSSEPAREAKPDALQLNADFRDAELIFPSAEPDVSAKLTVASLQTVGELGPQGLCVKTNLQGARITLGDRTLVSRLDVFLAKTGDSVKVNVEPVTVKLRRGVDVQAVLGCVAWQQRRLQAALRPEAASAAPASAAAAARGSPGAELRVWDYEVLVHGATVELRTARGERWLQLALTDCQTEGRGLQEGGGGTTERQSHLCRGQAEVTFLGPGGRWEPVLEPVAFRVRKQVVLTASSAGAGAGGSSGVAQWFVDVPEAARGVVVTLSEELLQSLLFQTPDGVPQSSEGGEKEEELQETRQNQQLVFVKNETGGTVMVHGPAESVAVQSGERRLVEYEGEWAEKNCKIAISGDTWFVARLPVDRDAVHATGADAVGVFEGEAKDALTSAVTQTPGSSALTVTLWAQTLLQNGFAEDIRVLSEDSANPRTLVGHGGRVGVKEGENLTLEVAEGKEVRRVRLNVRGIVRDQALKQGKSLFQLEAENNSSNFRQYFLCILVEVQIKKYRDLYTKIHILHIKPPVILRSALPCVLGFLLGPVDSRESEESAQRAVPGELRLDEQRQVCRLSLGETLGLRLCLFGSVWSAPTVIWPSSDGDKLSVVVHDSLGAKLRVSLEIQSRKGRPLEVLISVGSWLCVSPEISSLLEFANDHGPIARAGLQQASALPLHETSSLQVRAVAGGGPAGTRGASLALGWSEVFPIDTLGYSGVVRVSTRSGSTATGSRVGTMDISVRVASEWTPASGGQGGGGTGLTDVRYVVVRPKYVVVNRSGVALELADAAGEAPAGAEAPVAVGVGQEKALQGIWGGEGSDERRLRVRVATETGWKWSGRFEVSEKAAIEGDQVLQVFNESALYFMNIRVEVRIDEGVNFVYFWPSTSAAPDWVIRNRSGIPTIWVRQADSKAHYIPVAANKEVPFAWFEPTAKPKLIEVLLDNKKKPQRIPVELLADTVSGLLMPDKELGFLLAMEGLSTVVTVTSVAAAGAAAGAASGTAAGAPAAKAKAQLAARLDLPRLELSLVLSTPCAGGGAGASGARGVAGGEGRRREVLALQLERMVVQVAQATAAGATSSGPGALWEVRAKLGRLKVDDMREEAHFPVALCVPAAPAGAAGVAGVAGGGGPLELSVLAETAASSEALLLRRVFVGFPRNTGPGAAAGAAPAACSLAVDYGLVQELAGGLRRLQLAGTGAGAGAGAAAAAGDRRKVVVNELSITKFKGVLSFSAGGGTSGFGFGGSSSSTLVERLLGGMSGFEEGPVELKALVMKQARASESGVGSMVAEHYKHELYKSLRGIVGSAQALGNPVGLYGQIYSGLGDLLTEPLSAFEGSHSAGGEGGGGEFLVSLAEGTARGVQSFASKTTVGVLSSLGGLANTGANTLAILASDKGFYADRSEFRRKNKPNDIGQGLAAGAAALGSGLLSGISGLVTKPVEGMKKKGIEGLATGAVKGLGGLFLKPLAGILDLAGSVAGGVAQGVKAGAVMTAGEGESKIRTRFPRMMYGVNGNIRVFNEEHAILNHIVADIAGLGGLAMDNFVDFVFDGVATVLVVTTEHVAVVDVKDKAVLVRLPLWRIVEVSTPSATAGAEAGAGRGELQIVVVPKNPDVDPDSFLVTFANNETAEIAKKIVDAELAANR